MALCLAVSAACHKAPPGADQPAGTVASAATATPGAAPPTAETTVPAAPSDMPSPVATPAPSNAAPAEPSASSPEVPAPPANAAPPAPAPARLTIPAGTHLTVRLEAPLGSATSAVGQEFTATLVNGVKIHGAQAIPRHLSVVGKVVDAKAAGKFAGDASLGLRLESVGDHAVDTSIYSQRVQGKGARTAAVIGGTSVAGALLGALAGHGRGAAIGAVAGGGVGTLGAAETGNNRDIVLASGTVLTFKLQHPISVQPPPTPAAAPAAAQ